MPSDLVALNQEDAGCGLRLADATGAGSRQAILAQVEAARSKAMLEADAAAASSGEKMGAPLRIVIEKRKSVILFCVTQEVVLPTPGSVRRCVRYLRRRRGWNQAQLAQAVGRSQQWVSKFEGGHCEASVGDVVAALSALGAGITVRTAGAHKETIEHG